MSVAKVQLTGGNFQDSEGNLLVDGYLHMRLSQDEMVNDSQIGAGVILKINLNASGSVDTSTPQSVWGNDQMVPVNSFYIVTGYTAAGQIAWGPNNQQVIGNGGTFDVGTWVPNMVINWVPNLQAPMIQVNGTPLSSQTEVDFVNSSTVTFTDEGSGEIQASTPGIALPAPDTARFSLWTANAGASSTSTAFLNALDSLANSAGGGGGSLTVSFAPPSNSTGAAVQFEANTDQAASLTGEFVFWPGRKLTFRSTMRFWNDVVTGVNGVCFWGLTNTAANASNLPDIGDFIGFAVSETAGVAGNILLACSAAGVQTTVDSGIPATDVTGTSGIRYDVEVILESGTATMYVNGTSVATCSTNIPTNPLGLCWFQKASGGTHNLFTQTEFLYAENATL